MNVPQNLRYTSQHEWVRTEADGTVAVGITDHAQAALGDLVYLELPEVGRVLAAGDACAVVESVKAASDVYAPLAGEVVAVNSALADAPEQVNQDAYAAWFFKLKPADRGRARRAARREGVRSDDRRRMTRTRVAAACSDEDERHPNARGRPRYADARSAGGHRRLRRAPHRHLAGGPGGDARDARATHRAPR